MQRDDKGRFISPYPPGTGPPVKQQQQDALLPTWTAGIVHGPDGGEFRTRPRVVAESQEPPADADLLEEFDLDPAVWAVKQITRSKWQVGEEWRESYRVSFERRQAGAGPIVDPEAVLAPYLNTNDDADEPHLGEGTLCVPVGDLQLGKPDGGGTAETIDRFGHLTYHVKQRVSANGGVDRLILPWLGDCIEGLVSQGGRGVATLDIPISEQVRVYRRLMLHQIATLAPLAREVLVPVVPGNHDETYRAQRQPVTDSWAIEGASAVADALSFADQYAHVTFQFPEDEELNIVTDVGDVVLGFTHGHLWRSGQTLKWWAGQAHGRQPIGRADILISAHAHHLHLEQTGGGRSWLQIPALDGGSNWFRRGTGDDAPAGMMSFWITPEKPGWKELTIHV